ncbi:MAG: hypothetical protein AAF717_20310 [Bacteroidota bacterium]
MKFVLPLFLVSISLSSCNKEVTKIEGSSSSVALNPTLSYTDMLEEFDEALLYQTVEEPNAEGALGRNKTAYFHVRFQLNMSKLTDLAVVRQQAAALSAFVRTLEFSFNRQEEDGGFELHPPTALLGNPDIPEASSADLASGVAFFAYSLGLSLTTLTQSHWYLSASQTALQRSRVNTFDTEIALTLQYLKRHRNVLKQADQNAPNRLLFNAIAFYSLGSYLDDTEAKELGIEFVELALELVDPIGGYFIEGGGWDSSYNGVALKLGFEIFSMLPTSETKDTLGQHLISATKWQRSRVLLTGAIATTGNTRVFPGGEAFLGNEKTVDVEKTIRAFMYFAILTNDDSYRNLAYRILDYYQ